jgi:hypothetical protein
MQILKEIREKDEFHKEEIERSMQATRYELTLEFGRVDMIVETLCTKELNKALQT